VPTLIFASSAPVMMRCPVLSYSSENTGNPCPLNVAWWQYLLASSCLGSLLLLQWLLRARPACCSSCSCGCAAALLGFVTQGASGCCFGTDSDGKAAYGPSANKLLRPCSRQLCWGGRGYVLRFVILGAMGPCGTDSNDKAAYGPSANKLLRPCSSECRVRC
jgi:hypothetical protein